MSKILKMLPFILINCFSFQSGIAKFCPRIPDEILLSVYIMPSEYTCTYVDIATKDSRDMPIKGDIEPYEKKHWRELTKNQFFCEVPEKIFNSRVSQDALDYCSFIERRRTSV